MRVASFPSQVQTLLERETTAHSGQCRHRCPYPIPAEGHFSCSSPLKAHVVTDSGPVTLWGGNISRGASLQKRRKVPRKEDSLGTVVS